MTVVPNPPGDVPLVEGLGTEWNDIVSAIPEERRGEIAPKLKERVTSYSSQYEDLKPWEQFHKSGISPEQADTALRLYNFIESNPREVYETIGQQLGISTQQAQQVVEEIENGDEDDPRIAQLQKQVETLAQITLAQRQQESQAQQAAAADAQLKNELSALEKKYGSDIPEAEVLMRMAYKEMSAEQAYQDYMSSVEQIQKRRPAPFVLGGAGTVPQNAIDPVKLSSSDTKSLVAQMMSQAAAERRQ